MDHKITAVPPAYRGGYRDFWIAADVLEFTSHGYGGYLFDADGKKREFAGYRVDATTDFALEYLARPKEKPFFLFVSYIEPHYQNDHCHHEGPEGAWDAYARFPIPGDLAGTAGDWREEMPDYLACCRSLDDAVGRIVTALEEQGLYEDTILFYTSDHGSHFRTRNGEYKRSCHDDSIHVPFIAKGGCFDGGKTVSGLSSLIDIAPTILACAGIPTPGDMPGKPMQRLAEEPDGAIRDEVFIQISESCVGRALRTPEWTYCVEAPAGTDPDLPDSPVYEEAFLYDLGRDPDQRENLVCDPAYGGVRGALRERLLRAIRTEEGSAPAIRPHRARS